MRPLCDLVIEYIENEGIEVTDSIAFEVSDNLKVGLLDPVRLVEEVNKLDITGADAIVLSACVQMPSLPSIQVVEDRLGIPVTSTSDLYGPQHARSARFGTDGSQCGCASIWEI
jgi:maleate isomerase